MNNRYVYIVLFCVMSICCMAADADVSQLPPRPNRTQVFFSRLDEMLYNISMKGLDSNYIHMPEHNIRVALNTGSHGIHSTYAARNTEYLGDVLLQSVTTPSLDLGLQVDYGTLGLGYSWDVLHAYARKLNFSMGSKSIGIEFSYQRSTNFMTELRLPDLPKYYPELAASLGSTPVDTLDGVNMKIINVSMWYALNSRRYSHSASMKYGYIQRKTAGSPLLHLSYMATNYMFQDSLSVLSALMQNITSLQTHQVAVGIGYGINYTPNQGKFMLHLSGIMKVVCYTINHVYTMPTDSTRKNLGMPGYSLRPSFPVHVSGTMRAAMNWEINKWVHLALWGQADHLSFKSTHEGAELDYNIWNWQAHLSVGIRFGSSHKRAVEILDTEDMWLRATQPERYDSKEEKEPEPEKPPRIQTFEWPDWITDYIYTPNN